MNIVVRSLFTGLAVVLPLIITIELIRWLLQLVETSLAPLLQVVLPAAWYLPGMAIISFILLCSVIGYSSRWSGFNWLWQMPGKIMLKLPGTKQIYGMLQDIMDLMAGKNFTDGSVVMVKLPASEIELIGIITKQGGTASDRMSALMQANQLAVFIPMAYNVGGYTVIVPRSCTRNLDMKPAEALQLVMSGGLGSSKAPGTDR
uniref:Putative exported protein n=1 Tax=Rheinheimera sp. BAL341 TaxID=1708203 RepID=A0A486XH31_9GAMM